VAECTCTVTDPKTWTTHNGAVEPGSMMEPDPDCDAHFPYLSGCTECKVRGDHTWWCSIAPEVLSNGKRPYYWRDA